LDLGRRFPLKLLEKYILLKSWRVSPSHPYQEIFLIKFESTQEIPEKRDYKTLIIPVGLRASIFLLNLLF